LKVRIGIDESKSRVIVLVKLKSTGFKSAAEFRSAALGNANTTREWWKAAKLKDPKAQY